MATTAHRYPRLMGVWQALLCCTGIAFAFPALAVTDSARFEIAAQPLALALKAFADQAHMQLLYEYGVVRSATGNAVSGELERREALGRLLRGTGLEAVYVSDSAATIRPIGRMSNASRSQGGEDRGGQGAKSFWGRFRVAQAGSGVISGSARISDSSYEAGGTKPAALQEVVVTAEKREERLQDVPVPVTAISAPALATNNQLRIQDFYTLVPGLSVSPANQSTQLLSIRGITTGGVTNPTVGVTIDDVPYGASTNVGGAFVVPDIDPGDLERVEVLRGPQGTLYGASSMGGLLKFVTVDPSTDQLNGRVEGGVDSVHNGNAAGYSLRGSVNVPVGNAFAIRASAFTHLDPGYINNPVLHIDGINEERVSGGRLSGLWRLSDTVSLKLSATYQEVRGDGSNVVEAPMAGFPQTQSLGDLEQNDLRGTGGYDRKVQAYSATLKAKFGGFDLTAISGYNVNRFNDSFDYTYAFGSGTSILNYSRTDKLTQEVRLATSFGEHVDWLLGGFYTHEKSIVSENIVAADSTTGAVVGPLLYVPLPTRYEEYAGFTDFTLHVTDELDVQIGARESEIRQVFSETESGPLIGPTPSVIPNTDTNASAFTYLVTPRYRLTPDIMAYARFASGYRAGGSNPLPGHGTPPQYSPDKTNDYDLGVKGDFFDHRLSVDASLYYIDWKDVQIQLISPIPPHGDYNVNAGQAKSQGVELAVQIRPSAALKVSAWVTWDDAVLTEGFPAGSTAVGAAGDSLPNTAKFSANLSLDDEFPLWTGVAGFAGGSVSYVGSREGVFTSSPERQYFPAYARTDLHTGARYDTWTATLYVNNVADKRGVISGGLGVFPPFGFYVIQPRTIGLSLAKQL